MAWDETVYQGENLTLQLAVTGSDSSSVDITSASLYWTAKRQLEDADSAAVINKSSSAAAEINITTAASGLAEVYIVPADTAASVLTAGKYFYDVVILTSAGSRYVLKQSTFTLQANTRRT